MQLTSRLSVSLILGVAAVSMTFAFYQTRAQSLGMRRDLEQQALTRAFAGDAFVHVGGGGEYVMKNGIGVGADAGAIGLLFGGATGTLSLNGYYHFRRQRLVDPFVTA